jgi:hypothetical protein
VATAASMKSTVRLRTAALSGVGVVAVLALTSCASARKSSPGTTNSAPGTTNSAPATTNSAPGTTNSAPVASATPSTTSLAAASQQPAPAASSASVFGQLTVTGAENLKLTASNVKCEKTVAADGSALVDVTVLTPSTAVAWKLTISSSADSVAAFAAPVTYDLAAKNGPAAIQFLAADGSVGNGWVDGYTRAVQLPGSLALQPDQSGTIDSQLGAYGSGEPPIHLVASWKCSS